MQNYSWEQYYDEFHNWSLSTQKKNFRYLTNFGAQDEVMDIFYNFEYDDKNFLSTFFKYAFQFNYQFHPENVIEFVDYVEKKDLIKLILEAKPKFSEEELDDISFYLTEEEHHFLIKEMGIIIPEDEEDFEFEFEIDEYDNSQAVALLLLETHD